ncbi:hypothetical protein RZS08_28890, partial [Arthrospira platensis SPKY1]|nr:hypothetical protein [Arthrospira platensis SPKY1]
MPSLLLSSMIFGQVIQNRPKNPTYAQAVEQIEKRSENTATFVNADGSKLTAFSSVPLHYKNKAHQWEPIDY